VDASRANPILLLATTNAGKLREFHDLLSDLPFDVRTLRDGSAVPPPEEIGRTFAENARQKALYYAHATGWMTVAEDSGLEIEALDGAPGIHSARFGGIDTPYAAKFAAIYERLRHLHTIDSPARFVCAVALAIGDRVVFEADGTVNGRIAAEPRGTGGFGYDPIFFYPPFGCTLAEAGARKSTVSHRAEAVRKLRAFLVREGQDGQEGRQG
jgi:XTP/dITP diphosphohydrolase